jgi:ribosomal protein S12 methylthiotransferase
VSRVAIVTLGCPKNTVDSEGLGGLLAAGGHKVTQSPQHSDVVVVNTCGFIDPARRETVEEVLDLAELKEGGELTGLVLTGCLVARGADELASSLPEVDAFVDFAAYSQMSEIVTKVAEGTLEQRVHGSPGTRFEPAYWDATMAASPRLRFGRAPWSYVKIAEGCNRGCTFCAIPLMRGKLASRPGDAIEAEVRSLVAQGVSEISLVSQDSVMWGRDSGEGNLQSLLDRLHHIEEVRRIRLMYLHPQGLDDGLIDYVLASPKIASYFDLSLQHVAPEVLERMGRWGGRRRFERIIGRIRAQDPAAGVRSTFILGFPGESEGHASEVESFVSDTELDWVGVFTYSREVGTRSHDLDRHVPPDVARERAEKVTRAAEVTMSQRAHSLVGSTFEVMAERRMGKSDRWMGRSHREAPEIDGEIRFRACAPLAVGDHVSVRATSNDGADLVGELIHS